MKYYLDLCCLNRPFDEQVQLRVRLETQAVLSILEACRDGKHQFASSGALEVENSLNPNPERRNKVSVLMDQAGERVELSPKVDHRAAESLALGFGRMDAYHLASAEIGNCDRLATTDDQFLKQAAKHAGQLRVKVVNPVQLIAEEGFV